VRDILAITRAVADGGRLRILMMLDGQELCVCQIVAVLGLATSTVSKHLSILNAAGLIESRKDGRWVFYALPSDGASAEIRGALEWLNAALGDDAAIVADRHTLSEVLAVPRDKLCGSGGGRTGPTR